MAVLAEVIGRSYYARRNNVAEELPIGTQIVVRSIPEALKTKLRLVKEVEDGQLIINDNPEAAKFRDEGKDLQADKLMADDKEEKAKPRRGRPKKVEE